VPIKEPSFWEIFGFLAKASSKTLDEGADAMENARIVEDDKAARPDRIRAGARLARNLKGIMDAASELDADLDDSGPLEEPPKRIRAVTTKKAKPKTKAKKRR
jgi:hypothetical protein